MATTSAKRQRRSTEEVRKRLLDAARELFLAHGYEQTYTKDIAQKAGVAEKVLFSNFESKAGISTPCSSRRSPSSPTATSPPGNRALPTRARPSSGSRAS
jgi:hypothetical protein